MEIKRAQIWNRVRVWLHTANLAQTPRCALHNEESALILGPFSGARHLNGRLRPAAPDASRGTAG